MWQSSSAHLTTQKKQDPIASAFRFLEQYRSPKDIHENGPIVGTVDTLWRENASWLSQHNCLSPSDILLCPLWDMVCGSIFVWSFYRPALLSAHMRCITPQNVNVLLPWLSCQKEKPSSTCQCDPFLKGLIQNIRSSVACR